MTDKKRTQKTPTGLEIPVPTRGEFYKNLKKTAKPPKRSTPDSPKK